MKRILPLAFALLLMGCANSSISTLSGQITATEAAATPVATETATRPPIAAATDAPSQTAIGIPSETASSAPTLSPLPEPTNHPLLWSANWETGDAAQLYLPDVIGGLNNGGGIFNQGSGKVSITDKVAHSGHYSAEMTIDSRIGEPQAVRLFRWRESPAEAYFGVWYLFPNVYSPASWWNVSQFLSDGPEDQATMWVLNVGNRPTGEMFLYLFDWQQKKTYSQDLANIPVGNWTHVEVFYRRSTGDAGRITLWQDGIQLFDLQGVQTANSDLVKWSVDNYTDEITPSPATIYADDLEISTERVTP